MMPTLTVIPTRPALHPVQSAPRVFTDALIRDLETVNRHLRWLRKLGHRPIAIKIDPARPIERPVITMGAAAASLLIGAGNGHNTKRLNGERRCSVVIDGCVIEWVEGGIA